jgi:isocitrate/isopropylmalate dehydrogenase
MADGEKRVAVLPGDDAAPEAVHAALDVLQAMELPISWRLLPDGETLARDMSREAAEQLIREAVDSSDTLLFGATSGRTGGIGYLRWGKQTFANVRPVRWRPGFRSPLAHPEGIDYVIVRENTEDLYLGIEGELPALIASGLHESARFPTGQTFNGGEGRYAIKVLTRGNTERVARFACELARKRKAAGHPGKLTCSAKYNMLRRSDEFFRATVEEVAHEYPDITYEQFIVDDMARRLVACPHELDVVLLPNLYGDILSDEAAGTIGGLGVAPSGCFGADYAYFEPVHGTAPDIVGRQIINPTATLLSAVMLLEYLGMDDAARRLDRAVGEAYRAGDCLTPDQGGSASTGECARAVLRRL